MNQTYKGACFCGAVELSVTGEPVAAGYRHEPKLHVNYGDTVLRIKDGLPKMKDLPEEMGGPGETVVE